MVLSFRLASEHGDLRDIQNPIGRTARGLPPRTEKRFKLLIAFAEGLLSSLNLWLSPS